MYIILINIIYIYIHIRLIFAAKKSVPPTFVVPLSSSIVVSWNCSRQFHWDASTGAELFSQNETSGLSNPSTKDACCLWNVVLFKRKKLRLHGCLQNEIHIRSKLRNNSYHSWLPAINIKLKFYIPNLPIASWSRFCDQPDFSPFEGHLFRGRSHPPAPAKGLRERSGHRKNKALADLP